MRIYLDACAVNRLTDDTDQPRVLAEADAMLDILRLVSEGKLEWTVSEVLSTELSQNPDEDKRQDALDLLERAGPRAPLSSTAEQRAHTLAALGYGIFDALHLACAEGANADALLTTDDRFIRKASRGLGNPAVIITNPVDWLREVPRWSQRKN